MKKTDKDCELGDGLNFESKNKENNIANVKWIDADLSEDDIDNEAINNEDAEVSISSEDDMGVNLEKRKCSHCMTQDLWDTNEVWESLQSLPGGETLASSPLDPDYIISHPSLLSTGLLMAAYLGEGVIVEKVLEAGAKATTADKHGRTALHLAAHAGSARSVTALISHGAELNEWDSSRIAMPLHCAACAGSAACVRTLLRGGAEVNAGLSSGQSTALLCAAKADALECVLELLDYGACPNTPQVFTETPLHAAAALGSSACVSALLRNGASVRVQRGADRATPLHLAAEEGAVECVQMLLDAGAQTDATNRRAQTPLHLAALAQSPDTLSLLLSRGAMVDRIDADGRTALHGAIVKISSCNDCVRILLDNGADVNKPDAFGYTPLHLAALNELSSCVLLLLNHGGDVTAKTNGGVSVLSFIVRRTPDVLPRYLNKLDQSIKLTDHELGDVDCELKLDFRILVPCVGRGETELFLTFIDVGQREILKHPLCETFLFLKWKRIRKFFLFSLFYHCVFVLLFTGYVIGVFLRDCPHPRGFVSTPNHCTVPVWIVIMGYFLFILTVFLVIKEMFQMAHGLLNYMSNWENWLQCLIIISVPLCAVSVPNIDITKNVGNWQHHVAAIGIFLTWVELMLIVGRFPVFGLYVQMFQTVAVNFSKFLVAYCCLLIAFGLSFGVLFTNYSAFKDIIGSLLKTVIMMSGELEFEDIFYGDHMILYPVTSHLLFLAFVLLVTVILTNLLVGLAVSDIQGLQQSAGLDRLVRQAELVAHLESMLFSRLLRWIPSKILAFCHKSALLLSSSYHWALYIRPNDPRENRVPKELIKSIYELVAKRKEKPKSKKYVKFQTRENGSSKISDYVLSRTSTKISRRILGNEEQGQNITREQILQMVDDIQQTQLKLQQKTNLVIEQIESFFKTQKKSEDYLVNGTVTTL